LRSPADDDSQLLSRLEQIVDRMQDIQRAIKSVAAPPSLLEIGELKELGLEYADIVERLKARRSAAAAGRTTDASQAGTKRRK
jgi:hypothetical protein